MKLTLGNAIALAAMAHQDQMDRNGVDPYILHPLAVMAMVDTEDEKIVAVLHDGIEDTRLTLETLRTFGATPVQMEALDGLTHRKNEPYRAYVLRALNTNMIARRVKIADHRHNTDTYRLSRLEPELAERLHRKYRGVSDLILKATNWFAHDQLHRDAGQEIFTLITDEE